MKLIPNHNHNKLKSFIGFGSCTLPGRNKIFWLALWKGLWYKVYRLIYLKPFKIEYLSTEEHSTGWSQVCSTARQPGVACMTTMCYVIIFRYNTLLPDVLGVDIRTCNWTFVAFSAYISLTCSDVLYRKIHKIASCIWHVMQQKALHFELGLRCIVSALTCRSQEINAEWQINFFLFHRILFSSSLVLLFTLACLSAVQTMSISQSSFSSLLYFVFPCNVSLCLLSL